MEKFLLNGKEISIREILDEPVDNLAFSEFELKTVKIIRNWIRKKKRFSFQTSGSTGNPKKITFSRDQIVNSVFRTIKTFNLKEGDTFLSCLNTEFVAGFMMIVRAIVGKAKLIILEPTSNPLALLSPEQTIDFVAMTPIQVQTCLEQNPESFNDIRKLLVGGASLHHELEARLRSVQCDVFHSYAMTETLTHVAIRDVHKDRNGIYHALKGVTFDQHENGCLIVNDDRLTIRGLRTNDLVEFLDRRSFRLTGRLDNVINSGGVKVQADQLELDIQDILLQEGIAAQICMVSRPDERLTNKLVLLIKTNDRTLDAGKLLKKLKAGLRQYHDPKEIIWVPHIFLTKSGKIDRPKNAMTYI